MRVGTGIVAAGCFILAAAARAQSGTIIVVNKAGSTVSLVDLKTHALTATVPTGEGPHETAVSPDGRLALVTDYGPARSAGSTITVIDIAQGALDKTISIAPHRRPHGIVWLPDGKRALVTSESDSALLVVDVDSGAVTSVIRTGQAGSQLIALTPDGERVYVTNLISGSVTLLDLATHAALRTAVVPGGAEGLALRPDGKEVWVTSRASDRITVLSADDLSVLATIETGKYPNAPALHARREAGAGHVREVIGVAIDRRGAPEGGGLDQDGGVEGRAARRDVGGGLRDEHGAAGDRDVAGRGVGVRGAGRDGCGGGGVDQQAGHRVGGIRWAGTGRDRVFIHRAAAG